MQMVASLDTFNDVVACNTLKSKFVENIAKISTIFQIMKNKKYTTDDTCQMHVKLWTLTVHVIMSLHSAYGKISLQKTSLKCLV